MLNVFCPSLSIGRVNFSILGLLCGIFYFYSNYKRHFCNQTVVKPDQTPHIAVSDLSLHCLPMSHKRDARLIWAKLTIALQCFLFSFAKLFKGIDSEYSLFNKHMISLQ